MNCSIQRLLVCALCLAVFSFSVGAQHIADPDFKTGVEKPAFGKNTPRLMFDEAHNNFHTSTSRYKPFADLLMNDGYRLVVNRQPFTAKILASFKLLVIVNALGDDIDEPGAENSAFTEDECKVVHDWVRSGGALLLIADPGPFGKSAASLAKQFGVEMFSNVTEDPENAAEEFLSNLVVYSRNNKQLIDHPITLGRDAGEKVNRVVVFRGQSLKGPQDSAAFLKLAETARDVTPSTDGTPPSVVATRGAAQGLAMKVADGRVVILGEADMLSALLGEPPQKEPIGMNYPGVDNKQLTLNLMHWLSGILK